MSGLCAHYDCAVPHVRMMKTGYENGSLAKKFGLPYVILRDPRPYDSTTLNYNWQVWETNAFSVYTDATDRADPESMRIGVNAVITFLKKTGVLTGKSRVKYDTRKINEGELINVKSKTAGIFRRRVAVNDEVRCGDVIADIIDPYDFTVKKKIKSRVDGVVFFAQDSPLAFSNAVLFKLIKKE